MLTINASLDGVSKLHSKVQIAEITINDLPYSVTWCFSVAKSIPSDSLSILGECFPLMPSKDKSSWYNIVKMTISIHSTSFGSLKRSREDILSSTNCKIEFDGFGTIDVLMNSDKGYIIDDKIRFEINIEKHHFFKTTPYESVAESYWEPKEQGPSCPEKFHKLIPNSFNCFARSDVTIKASDGFVPGHKFILAAYSNWLDHEMYVNGKTEIDTLADFPRKKILSLLSYFYQRDLIFSEEILLDIHEMSIKVGCVDILTFCVLKLTPQLAHRVINIKSTNTTKELFQRSYQLLEDDLERLFHTDQVLQWSRSFLESVLKSETVKVSEFDLFSKCVKWAETECIRAGKEVTPENKRDAFGDLRYLIRFNAMTVDELKKAFDAGILTREEENEICRLSVFRDDTSKFNYKARKPSHDPLNFD